MTAIQWELPQDNTSAKSINIYCVHKGNKSPAQVHYIPTLIVFVGGIRSSMLAVAAAWRAQKMSIEIEQDRLLFYFIIRVVTTQ